MNEPVLEKNFEQTEESSTLVEETAVGTESYDDQLIEVVVIKDVGPIQVDNPGGDNITLWPGIHSKDKSYRCFTLFLCWQDRLKNSIK